MGLRIVFEEDGYPRELTNEDEYRRAIATGSMSAVSEVTIYRAGMEPFVAPAGTIDELKSLFGIPVAPVLNRDPDHISSSSAEAEEAVSLQSAGRVRRTFGTRLTSTAQLPNVASLPTSSAFPAPSQPAESLSEQFISPFAGAPAQKPASKFADFSGRATRGEYWGFSALLLIGLAVAYAVFGSGGLIVALFLSVVPSFAVSVRRLHDVNLSGWTLLIAFIPYLGSLILLIIFLLPTKEGNNKYGPQPVGSR